MLLPIPSAPHTPPDIVLGPESTLFNKRAPCKDEKGALLGKFGRTGSDRRSDIVFWVVKGVRAGEGALVFGILHELLTTVRVDEVTHKAAIVGPKYPSGFRN